MSTLIAPGFKKSIRQGVISNNPLSEQASLGTKYVKVLKVVLNENDIDASLWASLGYSQALYGVFYQDIFETDESSVKCTIGNFAYCAAASIRRIPLKGELIVVQPGIRADNSQDPPTITRSTFWIDVVPAWNSPAANFFVPSGSSEEIQEPVNDINPLQLGTGDFTLEGRYGQSIRLGGGYYKGSLNSEETSEMPYTIIRNGQGSKASRGDEPVYENINADSSSIYLTTAQTVKLTEANTKRDSWKSNAPKAESSYSDPQIILNSDRIIANARTNDIELLAKQNIGLAAQRVGIDGKDFVSMDANKVYLGKYGQAEAEPVLKGQTVTSWLSNLCGLLNNLLSTMSKTTTEAQLASLATAATVTQQMLQVLSSEGSLKSLQSKKVYTE